MIARPSSELSSCFFNHVEEAAQTFLADRDGGDRYK